MVILLPAVKRLIAILFLSVFLFNLFGYRLLISYWQYQEESKLEAKTQTISDEELVSIKVATVLPPYTYVSDTYETVNGEVDVDGMTYKYVKRKIFKDSIEFLCIAHVEKKRLENAREEFFKLSNDLQNATNQKKNTNTLQIKPISFEYCSLTESYNFLELKESPRSFCGILTAFKSILLSGSLDHPPEETLA